jgi:hypothetical protein
MLDEGEQLQLLVIIQLTKANPFFKAKIQWQIHEQAEKTSNTCDCYKALKHQTGFCHLNLKAQCLVLVGTHLKVQLAISTCVSIYFLSQLVKLLSVVA